MKVEKVKKEFQPITIVLETQEKVDKIFAIVNHNNLCNALGLVDLYNMLDYYQKDYSPWFDKLEKAIKKCYK